MCIVTEVLQFTQLFILLVSQYFQLKQKVWDRAYIIFEQRAALGASEYGD